jgi:hypothetical protein
MRLHVLYQVAELVCSNEYRRKQWATYTNWIVENGKTISDYHSILKRQSIEALTKFNPATHSYECINASHK